MRSSKPRAGQSAAASADLRPDAAPEATLASADSSFEANSAGESELGTLLIGRMLCGKWRIERLLGVGGMSFVFAATHRNGNRVAIKVLKPELAAHATVRQRFLREGYIANRVGHDAAAAVLDDNASEEGLFFLVVELVRGETLDAYSQRRGGRVPASDVAQLSEQLLEVVAAAHQNQIIHRDIKPSNVFRTPEGRIKLLDFGIATIRESAIVSHTASGAVLGTPAFMSPEQARGRHDEVDVRADVWAVGATMFRLLSGRLVHVRATPHETMIATATEPAESLAVLCPDLPKALTRIVDTALKLDPKQRFQTAASMLAALRAVNDSEPAALEPRAHQSRVTRTRLIWLSLSLAALGAVLTVGALALVPRSPSPRVPAPKPTMYLEASQAAGKAAPSALAAPAAPSAVSTPAIPSAHVEAGKLAPPPQPRRPQPAQPIRDNSERPLPARSRAEPQPQSQPQPGAAASAGLDLTRILGNRR